MMKGFTIIQKWFVVFNISCCLFFSFSNLSIAKDKDYEEFGIEYPNLGYQYDFIDILIENKVPFYIDTEGIIRIRTSYKKEVERLSDFIENRPSMKLNNRKYASILVLLFKIKKIEYAIRHDVKTGEIHFIWDKKDDAKAKDIIDNDFKRAIEESYTTGKLGVFLGQ